MSSCPPFSIDSKVRMPSGHEMPVLGFGVYQTPRTQAHTAVSHALKTGYRHVDSAAVYRNEAESAQALQDSGIPREQLFFTTKVPPGSISYEGAKSAVEESLTKTKGLLGGYFDLVLLHAPFGGKTNRLGAWDALVEHSQAGHIRSIGVSNYGVHHLDELEAHIKAREQRQPGSGGILSVNQIELHPFLARPDVAELCRKRGVVAQAWGPLVRASRWGDERVRRVCERVGRTEAQVLVRWSLQMGFVPLPKSVTPNRIEENARVFDFELSEEDMETLHTTEYSPSAWDPAASKD